MGSAFDEASELLRWAIPSLVVALNPEKWVTVQQAAVVLGCSDNYVRKLAHKKVIASVGRGRKLNVRLADVLEHQLGNANGEAVKPNTKGLRKAEARP